MSSATAVPAPAPNAASPSPRRWWMLGVLCLSLLIVFVGNSSLNVAIPTLARDLHATEAQLQWVVAAYSLVFAGLLFSTGAIGDRFGRKGALQLGLVGFLVAATLAALSTEMWQLIACRALMGAAAAFIMPSTLSILVNVFPAEERAKAIAIWAGTTGAAGAIGPVASGWLLTHFWYGAVFLVNVPIIVVALVAGRFLVPKSRDPQEERLDPVGAAFSIVGIGSLVYALIEAPESGWGSTATLASFAVAAVVLGVFVVWERRAPSPMLDMRLFRNAAFSAGTTGMILVFLSMYGVMFLMSQYFQLVVGYGPLSTALRLLPMAPIMIVVAPLTPRLSARFGANRVVAGGMLLIVGGFAMFHQIEVQTDYWYLLVSMVPLVSGIALAMSPMTAAIMSAVPPRRAGAGSAMNDASRELGAALGVAVLGSIASSHYRAALDGHLAGLPHGARQAASGSLPGALGVAARLPAEAGAALARAADEAFVGGIHLAVVGGALLALAASFVAYRWVPRRLEPHGAMAGPVEAIEEVAELGLAGLPPAFGDDPQPAGAE